MRKLRTVFSMRSWASGRAAVTLGLKDSPRLVEPAPIVRSREVRGVELYSSCANARSSGAPVWWVARPGLGAADSTAVRLISPGAEAIEQSMKRTESALA